jgi:hypothetical protein
LSIGPIVAAALFEQLHLEDASTLTAIDIEAAFLLATPISPLPADADGVCSLAMETGNGSSNGNGAAGRGRHAGVEVTVDRGRIVSCITKLSPEPRNWASGTAVAWLEAVIHRRPEQLRIGGDSHLACSLVNGINEQLFDPARYVS